MTAVESDGRCARISLALDEPMAGTAPSTRRWLCVERPGGWPRDISQEREPAVAALLARATASGFRPLLIRSAEPAVGERPPRVFLADTTPVGAVTTTVTFDDPDELNDLPLPDPDHPLPGEPVTEPLLLVCTHDERDACCGLDGAALLDAVSGPNVFACSHLGGHRFAPTAMVLPTGYLYGRLDPISAQAVRAAAGGRRSQDRPLPRPVHVVPGRAGRRSRCTRRDRSALPRRLGRAGRHSRHRPSRDGIRAATLGR